MFYVFLIFHILILLETYFLWKNKLRKKAILLGGSNLILGILNILAFLKTFSLEYSSILYFQNELSIHGISNVLWILLNIAFYALTFFIIIYASKRKKQNIWLKGGLYFLLVILTIFFSNILMRKITPLLLFLACLALIFYFGKEYIVSKKNYYFVITFFLMIITFYSYATYSGSARLAILLTGYPKQAYETGLEELKYYEEKDFKRYSPIVELKLPNGRINIIDVKNYGFIKFSSTNR